MTANYSPGRPQELSNRPQCDLKQSTSCTSAECAGGRLREEATPSGRASISKNGLASHPSDKQYSFKGGESFGRRRRQAPRVDPAPAPRGRAPAIRGGGC